MNEVKRILTVIGTRPNFIKVTQFRKAAKRYPHLDLKIVHTGQHFDGKMADVFFEQFGLVPDFFLNVPAAEPAIQIREIGQRLEKVIAEYSPDLMIVVGDVNSTLAAAETAHRMGVKLAHVESGLRSFDDSMPEEYNRKVADRLSQIHFVTEPSGLENLAKEHIGPDGVFFVGNTMIDTMVAFEEKIRASNVLDQLNVSGKEFILMTMHRPGNVDSREGLQLLSELINALTAKYHIIFPVHPRTVRNIKNEGMSQEFENNDCLIFTPPLDYFSFQKLIKYASLIITDSGGIQEESTFLKVPCLTLRPNTERPITITVGSNRLIEFNVKAVLDTVQAIRERQPKKSGIPELWDGHATERIFEILDRIL